MLRFLKSKLANKKKDTEMKNNMKLTTRTDDDEAGSTGQSTDGQRSKYQKISSSSLESFKKFKEKHADDMRRQLEKRRCRIKKGKGCCCQKKKICKPKEPCCKCNKCDKPSNNCGENSCFNMFLL